MEIGSNFDLDIGKLQVTDMHVKIFLGELHPVYLDSGRSAIRVLALRLKKGRVLLPSYICRSVVDSFGQDFEIEYYLVDECLQIDRESLREKMDDTVTVVYVMHYFGILQKGEILEYLAKEREKRGFLILEDTTHSLLTAAETVGDYQICSLRKWFPIPDGGVLYGQHTGEISSRGLLERASSGKVTEAMILKHLCLRLSVECNSLYRRIFAEQEDAMDTQQDICRMSEVSELLLKYMDLEGIAKARRDNWNTLIERLDHTMIQPIYQMPAEHFVPFALPVIVKDRDRFRHYLMEHQIYCAVHWPMETEHQKRIPVNCTLERNILSLPIDQRYTREQMNYLAEAIHKYK